MVVNLVIVVLLLVLYLFALGVVKWFCCLWVVLFCNLLVGLLLVF